MWIEKTSHYYSRVSLHATATKIQGQIILPSMLIPYHHKNSNILQENIFPNLKFVTQKPRKIERRYPLVFLSHFAIVNFSATKVLNALNMMLLHNLRAFVLPRFFV